MSKFDRKVTRNQLRKKFKNKGLGRAWYYIMHPKEQELIEKLKEKEKKQNAFDQTK